MADTLFSLKGKRAIVTGGGAGIGLEMAMLFAKRGAEVFVLDISEEGAKAAAAQINALPGLAAPAGATGMKCDVTSKASVKACFDAVVKGGGFHILCNNAGIGHVGAIDVAEEADLDRVMKVNVNGVFLCAKEAVAHFIDAGRGGVILNTGSCASLHPIKDRVVYAASKGAVKQLTWSLATDHVHQGIRCNCICPGRVHTPFVDGFVAKNYPGEEKKMFKQLSSYMPQGRMATPGEIAAMALYLVSDEARFVTGAMFAIDGGIVGADHPKVYDIDNEMHPSVAAKL